MTDDYTRQIEETVIEVHLLYLKDIKGNCRFYAANSSTNYAAKAHYMYYNLNIK